MSRMLILLLFQLGLVPLVAAANPIDKSPPEVTSAGHTHTRPGHELEAPAERWHADAALSAGMGQLAELSELLPDHLGPRAPGRVDRHYAPRTPAYRVPAERWAQVLRSPPAANVQALSWAPLPEGVAGICLGDEPIAYARELYRSLRQLDRAGADCILVQEVPADAAWMAVADRLSRATLPLPADAA